VIFDEINLICISSQISILATGIFLKLLNLKAKIEIISYHEIEIEKLKLRSEKSNNIDVEFE